MSGSAATADRASLSPAPRDRCADADGARDLCDLRGCESAFSEQFRNFQYLAQARIDTGPGPASALLARLRPVLVGAGFTVEDLREEPNGFTTLAAAKGNLSASFVHTGGPFVGLDVSGPCIDVPEDQRETWLRKEEPNPEIR